jgi:hypothetical protein
MQGADDAKNRSLPSDLVAKILSSKLGIPLDAANLRGMLKAGFGTDASSKMISVLGVIQGAADKMAKSGMPQAKQAGMVSKILGMCLGGGGGASAPVAGGGVRPSQCWFFFSTVYTRGNIVYYCILVAIQLLWIDSCALCTSSCHAIRLRLSQRFTKLPFSSSLVTSRLFVVIQLVQPPLKLCSIVMHVSRELRLLPAEQHDMSCLSRSVIPCSVGMFRISQNIQIELWMPC